MGVSLKISAKS